MASAHSFASDIRLSYVLGTPNFGGSASPSATLKHYTIGSGKLELTYLPTAKSPYFASVGIGSEASKASVLKTSTTPYESFEGEYNFYFAQVGYRYVAPTSNVNESVEAAFSLGNGNTDFKRKGGSKINLKNVQYQALDIRIFAPFLIKNERFVIIGGGGVSKGTVRDFTLDGTRYSGDEFDTSFLWQLGIGYHFGGE